MRPLLLPLLLFLPLLNGSPGQAAAYDELLVSADRFCTAVRTLNGLGQSAAPGTTTGALVAAKANQSATSYANLWRLAKVLPVPSCRTIW